MKKRTSKVSPADRSLAGLQVDLLQKIRNGKIGLEDLEWFLKLSRTDLVDFQRETPITLEFLLQEIKKLFQEISPNNYYIDCEKIKLQSNFDFVREKFLYQTSDFLVSNNRKLLSIIYYLKKMVYILR